ncbi:hypothetical protein DRO54_04605 [Candidatus Bathyarchaeota archaeon]|nr:MAG: hypothetical protein DRO54_04605 [Candidatus Bathyarchaeota archaeon]
MRKPMAFLRLIRPANCLMMGFAVIVGAMLAAGTEIANEWLKLLLGFLTGFALTGASMAINDYYDREIDAINEPQRPIPSGAVTPNQALVFAAALTIVGLLAAFATNLECLALAILSWIISVSYVTFGKRTGLFGNFLVSTCVSMPFVYGNFVVKRLNLAVFLFAAMAFLSNTGREITKGIVDVEGDRTKNIKTLAVRFGVKIAALTAAFFYVIAVALSPLPIILGLVSIWYIPFVLITDFGLVFSSASLLRDYSKGNAKRVKNMVLVWFFFGLLAFIFGAL